LPDQAVEPAKGPFSRAVAGRLDRLSRLENPLLRSFLALAGANTWLRGEAPPEEAEDGMLNAEDVVSMDLTGTELVVLSACETGLGRVRVGEGVFGLRRAFVLAGAKTLVMSLWKVPDEETRRLMETFYRALLDGRSRADALRQAQLAIRRDYPDDPLRWGGFICQGEPGPMRGRPDTFMAVMAC
jgi:CHAT domain-containing protein